MAAAVPPRQLALALEHGESFDREDFLPGPGNAAALAMIERWPDWPARTIAIVGPEGTGKSHLAAIWATTAGGRMVASRAFKAPAVPQELATGALVIEDDGERDEAALFHLLNLVQEERGYVLITSRQPPASWPVALPDLASRLRQIPVATLDEPNDAMLRAVLVKLFADRQLAVDGGLIDFLMPRIERSFAGARAVVIDLDREALRQQRPVNRTLAGEVLRRRGT
jgi:chromosomal replication initiation ATPase DnaA